MTRCYVCNAGAHDGCQAIGGEAAECPRPSGSFTRWMDETAFQLAREEAMLALDSYADRARYAVHMENARRIAVQLGALEQRQAKCEEVAA